MHSVALIMLLALIEFMVLGGMVGYARAKYGVKAPAIAGHDIFERHFRVHYNTMEQLVVFLPALWLFAQYISTQWATILGAIFIAGRALYAMGYVRDPKKREFGSILSAVGTIPLVFGALYGVVNVLLE